MIRFVLKRLGLARAHPARHVRPAAIAGGEERGERGKQQQARHRDATYSLGVSAAAAAASSAATAAAAAASCAGFTLN